MPRPDHQSISYGSIEDERDAQFRVECCHGIDCELFLLSRRHPRCHPVGPYEYSFDSYSEHYLIRHQDRPVGALTATRLVAGELGLR